MGKLRYSFLTFGCKVNQAESNDIRKMLNKIGIIEVEDYLDSEIIFINSCTVTQKADRKSFSALRRTISRNPYSQVFMIGCAVDYRDGDKPFYDKVIFVKNSDRSKIPKLVSNFIKQNNIQLSRKDAIENKSSRTRGILKIQDGCKNFCSFCIVPYVRNKLCSKEIEEVIQEFKLFIDSGFKEVVLSGICLGSYGEDINSTVTLTKLLKKIENLKGDFRVRLSSIEPTYVSDELIEILKSSKRLCPHLHIPFQSGDDEILERMNRPYKVSYYIELVKKIRLSVPKIAITTDIMVGFPGESEQNFSNTVSFLEKIRPSRMHIFPYSPRKNTRASFMDNDVSQSIKTERVTFLKRLADKYSLAFRKQYLNKVTKVLIESKVNEKTNTLSGYSENYIPVQIKCDTSAINTLKDVAIVKINNGVTIGKIC